MTRDVQPQPAWMLSALRWLTPRRLRAQALVLALCIWGVCAVDYATPGIFDRAGNVKFQDFLQFPVAAHLITSGHTGELYNDRVLADGIRAIVGRDTTVFLEYFYGPQVALPFIPIVHLPFLAQAGIWIALSLLLYGACVYLVWKSCAGLSSFGRFVAICAIAYPPVFHFFVRGQLSAAVLACVTLSYFAFRARRDWFAGIGLGLLASKPQFLVAIPLVLLLVHAWKALAGVAISAGAQLALTWFYFGPAVMRAYFNRLLHSASSPGTTELSLSPIQMHSLHTLWELLVPWPRIATALYILTSLAAIWMAAAIWKSSFALSVRFSTLILAAVLVNPHLYIYDLLALAPALLLLADWALSNAQHPSTPTLYLLLYLAFILPLFGPLARWTHLQLSVVVFIALLWTLYRSATRGHKLASSERAVV